MKTPITKSEEIRKVLAGLVIAALLFLFSSLDTRTCESIQGNLRGELENISFQNEKGADSLSTDLDSIKANKLRDKGLISIEIPHTMYVDSPSEVRVSIANRMDIGEKTALPGEFASNAVHESIRIENEMEVRLKEKFSYQKNFRIHKENNLMVQPVEEFGATIWRWTVVPSKAGSYKMSINTLIKLENGKMKDLPEIEREVRVVGERPFRSSYAQSRISFVLLILLLVFLVLLYRFREKIMDFHIRLPKTKWSPRMKLLEDKVSELISENEIEAAIKELEKGLGRDSDDEMMDRLTHLSSNYFHNESRFNRNLLSVAEYNRERSKVVEGLMDMVDLLAG